MGLLALAGAISGAGQALQEGLHTTQTGLIAEQLQKQREDLETQRQDRMMQFQQGRDTAAFAHADKSQAATHAFEQGRDQTKMGHDVLAADLANQRQTERDTNLHGMRQADTENERAYQEGAATRALEQRKKNLPLAKAVGMDEAKTNAEIEGAGFTAKKTMRDAAITEEMDATNLRAQDPVYLKNVKLLDEAKNPEKAAQAAATLWKLNQDKNLIGLRDAYLDALKSGDPKTIDQTKTQYRAATEKVGESEKVDLVNAAAGMRETGTEITRLSVAMKDMMPGDPVYAATDRRLKEAEQMHRAFTARVQELSGSKMPEAPKPVQIVDRFDKTAPAPTAPGGLVAQARGESIQAETKQKAEQAGTVQRERTAREAQAAMDADSPDMVARKGPVKQGALPAETTAPPPAYGFVEKPNSAASAGYSDEARKRTALLKPGERTRAPGLLGAVTEPQSPTNAQDDEIMQATQDEAEQAQLNQATLDRETKPAAPTPKRLTVQSEAKAEPVPANATDHFKAITQQLQLAQKRQIMTLAEHVNAQTDSRARLAAESQLRNYIMQTLGPMYAKMGKPVKTMVQDTNDLVEGLLKGQR